MGKEPITLKQEGKDGFELYKAAGKLGGKKAIVTGCVGIESGSLAGTDTAFQG
jgi:hypothetical protein